MLQYSRQEAAKVNLTRVLEMRVKETRVKEMILKKWKKMMMKKKKVMMMMMKTKHSHLPCLQKLWRGSSKSEKRLNSPLLKSN